MCLFDPEKRLPDMDLEGIDVAVLFPPGKLLKSKSGGLKPQQAGWFREPKSGGLLGFERPGLVLPKSRKEA